MTAATSLRCPPRGDVDARVRRCQASAALAGVLLVADWLATIADVGAPALNLAFTVVVMVVFPVGALAVTKAPEHLRRWALLSVGSLFIQIVANGIWYVDYLHDAPRLPGIGVWTITLYFALAVAAAAAWTGVREILRPRDTLLDYSIVVAAVASVGAAIIGRHLQASGAASVVANDLISAGLSLLIVVIIGSATLGRWRALPIPVGLMGLGLLFDAGGFLWSSYFFSHRHLYVDNRWPTVLWLTAAVLGLLAALAVIAGHDRPIRLTRKPLPGVSTVALLVPAAVPFAVALGVLVLGAATRDPVALYTGVGAVAWIAPASLIRAGVGNSETRAAFTQLDGSHCDLERDNERLGEIVTDLQRRNAALEAAQAMFRPLIEMADDLTDGQLRSKLEDAGDPIVDWMLGHDGDDK